MVRKKVVSIVLVLCMMCTMVFTVYASEYETYVKVSDELLQALNVSYEDLLLGDFEDTGETYSCIIWIEDVKIEEAVEAGIDAAEQTRDTYSTRSTYAYNYETVESSVATFVDVTLDDEESDEYVQTYIEAEREVAKEMYTNSNNQFVAENFMARDMSVTYVSQYTPCIFADLRVTKIADLIWESDVVRIDYLGSGDNGTNADGGEMSTLDIQNCLNLLRVNEAKSSLNLSGNGIKIGQLERACPDSKSVRKNPYYSNTLIEGKEDEHADVVYSIMHTIAPNATYYASGRYSSNTATQQGNYFEQIEWLLSSGVNVINLSHSFPEKYNRYDARARWLDHIAINHDVHIVQAAGNYGGLPSDSTDTIYGVASPGMAYNIITVGNCDWTGKYEIDVNSSYNLWGSNRANQRTYKPDVVAPAISTSYATPMVTGTVALMCELQPALKTKQPITKAILAAGAGPNTVRYTTTDEEFVKYGAGMIDTWAATYIVCMNRYSTSTGVLSTSTETSKTYTMSVTSDDSKMRIALAYMNYINLGTSSSSHASAAVPTGTIAELRIFVYAPNGSLVASSPVNSTTNGANLKVIEFYTNGVTGNYTIKVSLIEPASDDRITHFGVAWW